MLTVKYKRMKILKEVLRWLLPGMKNFLMQNEKPKIPITKVTQIGCLSPYFLWLLKCFWFPPEFQCLRQYIHCAVPHGLPFSLLSYITSLFIHINDTEVIWVFYLYNKEKDLLHFQFLWRKGIIKPKDRLKENLCNSFVKELSSSNIQRAPQTDKRHSTRKMTNILQKKYF